MIHLVAIQRCFLLLLNSLGFIHQKNRGRLEQSSNIFVFQFLMAN